MCSRVLNYPGPTMSCWVKASPFKTIEDIDDHWNWRNSTTWINMIKPIQMLNERPTKLFLKFCNLLWMVIRSQVWIIQKAAGAAFCNVVRTISIVGGGKKSPKYKSWLQRHWKLYGESKNKAILLLDKPSSTAGVLIVGGVVDEGKRWRCCCIPLFLHPTLEDLDVQDRLHLCSSERFRTLTWMDTHNQSSMLIEGTWVAKSFSALMLALHKLLTVWLACCSWAALAITSPIFLFLFYPPTSNHGWNSSHTTTAAWPSLLAILSTHISPSLKLCRHRQHGFIILHLCAVNRNKGFFIVEMVLMVCFLITEDEEA
jgi:hypothetical protein